MAPGGAEGAHGEGEVGLSVKVGSYARSAILLERNRSKLRLIDGEQLIRLVVENYTQLSPRCRKIIPLKQIYGADLPSF